MRRHCKSQSKSRIKKGIKVGNEELIENSRSYISYITIICVCGQRQRAKGLISGGETVTRGQAAYGRTARHSHTAQEKE